VKKRLQIRMQTDNNSVRASQAGINRYYEGKYLISDITSITDVFCGSTIASLQTTLAACCANGMKLPLHETDLSSLGTTEEMPAADLVQAAIRDAFTKIKNGGHGLIFCDLRTIQVIISSFGLNIIDTHPRPCEGFMFEQDDQDEITVPGILRIL